MRDIKFRALRKDGFGMAIGNLVVDAYDKTFIETREGTHLYTVKVDKETVGQFTGLKDVDGNDVYENDIVEAWSQGSFLPNGIIRYGKGSCKFFITNTEVSLSWNLSGSRTPYGFKDEHLKVIGNIHQKGREEKIKESK